MGAGTLDQVVVCSGSSRVAVAPRHRRRREVLRVDHVLMNEVVDLHDRGGVVHVEVDGHARPRVPVHDALGVAVPPRRVSPSRCDVAAATCGRVRAWAVGARSGGSRYSRVSSARRAVVCCGLRRPTAFFFLWPQGSCRHLGYVVAYRSRKHSKGVIRH